MVYDTFESKVASRGKYVSVAGDPTLDIYEYKVDKTGVRNLVKTDRKENVHDRIQADADACDINKLMARFSLGDSTALDQKSGFYGDVTKLPNSYAEMFDRVEQCRQFFDGLPVDLKQLFGNSFEVYFSTFGDESFNEKYAEYNKRFENHQFETGSVDLDTNSDSKEFVEVNR